MATNQKDITLLYVGGEAVITTGGPETLNDGEIGVFTPTGVRVTEANAATVDTFKFYSKAAGFPLFSSDNINKADIKSINALAYLAPANKAFAVGFNGTTGQLEAINDNFYRIAIDIRATCTSSRGRNDIKQVDYTSDIAATQYEVANALSLMGTAEFSNEADGIVVTEMKTDNAGIALGGGATLRTRKGTKYVVASSGAHGLTAGQLVRIGGAGATFPVYTVVEVSGTSIKLDKPFTGDSSLAVAGQAITMVPADNFGVVFFGVNYAPHITGVLHGDLEPVDFEVVIENFGTSTTSSLVEPTTGNGSEKQMLELEWFLQGNEGDHIRGAGPGYEESRKLVSGNYDMITLNTESVDQNTASMRMRSKSYILALPVATPNYALAGTANDITDVLEILASGALTGDLNV